MVVACCKPSRDRRGSRRGKRQLYRRRCIVPDGMNSGESPMLFSIKPKQRRSRYRHSYRLPPGRIKEVGLELFALLLLTVLLAILTR